MSIAKSSFVFAGGTLISRIAGLVRDRVVLAAFGSSPLMSGFLIAFRIPNMLREMLAEGALGSAFTKVYSSLNATDPKRAQKLLRDAFILMTIVALAVCALGIIAAPWIVKLITSESESAPLMVETATGLTRLLFPFLGFMILGAVAMGALHQKGRFFITSVSPLLFNVFSIFGALVLARVFPEYAPDWVERVFADKAITGLAVGTLLGGMAQSGLQLWGIAKELREGFRAAKGTHGFWSEDLKKMLMLMGPMTLAASAGQINTLINSYFATTAESGAVTWLYASFRLLHFPIGIFGIAISSAVLPSLSRALAKAGGKMGLEASREMQNAVELVLWLMSPCFIFFIVNDLQIVQCLYQSGRYTENDSLQTAIALQAYSYALISYGLSKVLTSFYFAMERTKYALKISLFTMGANATANFFLVGKYGHEGLAYGYSVSQALSVLLLIVGMTGNGIQFDARRMFRSLGIMVAAALAAGGLMELVLMNRGQVPALQELPIWLSSGVLILINGTICTAIFFAGALICLRTTPRDALKMLRRRRRSTVAE